MLFIVGGVNRSGKSTLAYHLNKKHGLPFFSLDHLMHGLLNGQSDIQCEGRTHDREKATVMWPIVKELILNKLKINYITDKDEKDTPVHYLMEGVIIRPEHCAELTKLYPNHIKTCWLGYTDIDEKVKYHNIKTFNHLPNDWLSKENDERIYGVIEASKKYSLELKKECQKFDIHFFDTGSNFEQVLGQVERYLYS